MVHVFVKAAQLFIHRRRPYRWLSDHALGTQHDKPMPERCTQAAAIYTNGFRAVAARQVVIEKTPNRLFIDLTNVQPTSARPALEVSKAAEVATNGASGIAAFGQVLCERINVGRKLTREKPNSRIAVKSSRRFHNGLLK